MKLTADALKSSNVAIPKPQSEKEIQEYLQNINITVAPAILDFWKTFGTGVLDTEFPMRTFGPSKEEELASIEDFDGFEGLPSLGNTKGIKLFTLWIETDSRTPVFYVTSGEFKDKLIAFPYSDLNVYVTKDTNYNLDEALKELDPQKIFSKLFGDAKVLE